MLLVLQIFYYNDRRQCTKTARIKEKRKDALGLIANGVKLKTKRAYP